jgi:hypothetical protein
MFSIKNIPTMFIDILEKNPTKVEVRTFIKENGETVITSTSSMFSILLDNITKYKLNETGINFITLKKAYKINSAPLFIKEISNLNDISIRICHKRGNLNKIIEKERINKKVKDLENNKEETEKRVADKLIKLHDKEKLKIIKYANNANKYKQLNLTGLKNDSIIEVRGYVSNKEPFSTLLTDQGTFINEDNLKDKMNALFPSNLKNEKYFEDKFLNTYFLLEPLYSK